MSINESLYTRIIEAIQSGLRKSMNHIDECDGGCDCGTGMDGGTGMYNNACNTVGMGNIVPAGYPCMAGADFANDAFNGSGDRFDIFYPGAETGKKAKKAKKRKIKIHSKR